MLIQANAKLNLSFKILGKLPGGYHWIESVMQSIDLADFLCFKKAKKTYLTGSILCEKENQLILKAKRILEEASGRELPCQIHLQKSIPISAGLGGGSCDAAATLVALNKLYNLNFSRDKLKKLAIKIGSDVPFFLYGGRCKVEGIGEKITPIKKLQSIKNKCSSTSNFYVVVRPHKRIETKMMYELYSKTGKNFLKLAQEICPDVKKVYNLFKKFEPKELNLSGSGPTVFCGVEDYKSTQNIVKELGDFNGDIFICRPQNCSLIVLDSGSQ